MGELIVLDYPPGATPLDPDEAEGLIPTHINTQNQLNEWEQRNILEAEKWINKQNFRWSEIVDSAFIKLLHQRMFDKTWHWAGEFRQTNKNIGVDWSVIPVELKMLLDDLDYQYKHDVYDINELAARFHHRLVSIHLFANGNGRHARLMTDVLLLSQGRQRFSWGRANSLVKPTAVRKEYIHALRQADKGDYQFLLSFLGCEPG